MSVTIKLTVPDQLSKQADPILRAFGYANRQELILEGFREIVQKKRLELLAMNFGKASPSVLKDRTQVVDAYEQSRRDILKELNFSPRKQNQK